MSPISNHSDISSNGRVLLALSGGVDSSVCALLLQQQGYQVEAMVIRFSPAHEKAVQMAAQAAQELNIPLHVCDGGALFEEKVVEPFCREYASGYTPNPCVVCNPLVKFHLLLQEADKRGIGHIATGHYAQIVEKDGLFYVAPSTSIARDQSYMLYRLPQAVLSRLLLPLGTLEKPYIREIASGLNLSSADAPDSQEICFIPDGDYPSFIANRGYPQKQGDFIAPDGRRLSPHRGILHYTVGQRRGLGVALGQPAYVKYIAPNGDVQLAFEAGMVVSSFTLTDILMVDGLMPNANAEYNVKIRSMARPVPCYVTEENGTTVLHFRQPQRSPAPGQHAVLYQNGLVVGGGVINRILT